MYNKQIPIYQYKNQLIEAIQQYQILLIVGETGSGKTTQLPQYILNELEFHGDSDNEITTEENNNNNDKDKDNNIKKKSTKKPSKISIAVTQPRRIAAIAAAQQVCREYNGSKNYHLLGKDIGYKIRFENMTTPNVTKLTYMTDGVLLREIIEDPLLSNYNIIIIDEAHERSIETDILLGLMKKACRQRSDLKLLVMSATLNMVKFSDFFDECPIFSIPGRLFDVDIFYQKNLTFASSKSKYVSLSVDTALNIHQNQSLGHILVFLTGQSEIERACKEIKELEKELDYSSFPFNIKLYNRIGSEDPHIMEKLRDRVYDHDSNEYSSSSSLSLQHKRDNENEKDIDSRYIKGLYIYPIYSVLETRHQKSIFKEVPPGYRKVIFATNIAQTSLTIPGIKYVIDSGFVKQFIYRPELSMDILDITPISKTAAIQRAGRAGRTQNGKVYRLYSKLAYEELEQDTLPEIKRCNLLGSVLLLKKLKLKNILDFDFIDKPNLFLEVKAIQELYFLEALNKNGRITETGNLMADFPISPYLAKVLLSSIKFKCSAEVIIIVSMLSVEDVYITPRGQKKQEEAQKAHSYFHHISGDHMTMLNIYKQWEINHFSKEWCRKYFLHYRALVTARNIKGQLELIFQRLNLPIISCHRNAKNSFNNNNSDNNHHHHHNNREHEHEHEHEDDRHRRRHHKSSISSNNSDDSKDSYHSRSHRHHHRNHRHHRSSSLNDNNDYSNSNSYNSLMDDPSGKDDEIENEKIEEEEIYDPTMKDYDYTLILKSVCQAYYMNVAKRFTGRPYFYNYKQSTSDTLLKMFNKEHHQELVPLFIHPSSSIHATSHSYDSHYLEWVIYHHTIFTNRCYLRHVSIINFEWVKELIDDMDKVDYSRLLEKDITSISKELNKEKKIYINHDDDDDDMDNEDDEDNNSVNNENKNENNESKRKIGDISDIENNNERRENLLGKRLKLEEEIKEDTESQSSQSISEVSDSRKAALQRYLQRKQLKEKKNKRK